MAMIGVQEIRSGTAFLLDGQPYLGLKYEHIKMGRGSATIKIKARHLINGSTVEKSFVNSSKVEEIDTAKKTMQFLYSSDGDNYFLDQRDFNQVSVGDEILGEDVGYLKEGLVVNIFFWDDRVLWVELPPKIEFKILQTDPGVKGNSVANSYKSAKLDNGMVVKVPLFVNEGERVLIDTRDGSYVERVK